MSVFKFKKGDIITVKGSKARYEVGHELVINSEKAEVNGEPLWMIYPIEDDGSGTFSVVRESAMKHLPKED